MAVPLSHNLSAAEAEKIMRNKKIDAGNKNIWKIKDIHI